MDAVRTLAAAAYEPYTERIGRPPAPVGADYADLIARGTTWVAEHDGRIVGFVVLVRRPDHLLLDNVAVAPEAQGLGIGSRLLRLAEEAAARSGLGEIRLLTNEAMTENLGYYARKGYVETGRGVQDGYRRVFFRKLVAPARPDGRSQPDRRRTPPPDE